MFDIPELCYTYMDRYVDYFTPTKRYRHLFSRDPELGVMISKYCLDGQYLVIGFGSPPGSITIRTSGVTIFDMKDLGQISLADPDGPEKMHLILQIWVREVSRTIT